MDNEKPHGDGIARPEEGGESPDVGSEPGKLQLRIFEAEHHVIVQFGREIDQLNLTPEQAVGIATVLIGHAKRVAAKRIIAPPGGPIA